MFLVATDPAVNMLCEEQITPGPIIAFAPIQTPSSMMTGFIINSNPEEV